MTRRGYARCVNVEEICEAWGGGHMCTGRCGLVHLHGRAWSWWRCPVCHLTCKPASVKRREQRQRVKEQT